jgi:hypothetical protein
MLALGVVLFWSWLHAECRVLVGGEAAHHGSRAGVGLWNVT